MSVVTLRPNATIYNGGTLTGGATLWGVLSDNSDASYVTKAAVSPTDSVGMGTTSKPAGSVLRDILPRVRAQPSAGTSKLDFWAKYGGYEFGKVTAVTCTALGNFSGVRTVVGDQLQAFIDGIELHVRTNYSSANSSRYVEGYIDFTFAEQPVVVVTGPASAGASSAPVTWTYTDGVNGGPQTGYEVKVFTAAQYGAAGFNASTSTPLFTSGQVLSSATTHTATGLLAGNHKAYVRAAQSVNGVLHWSAFDDGAVFLVTLTTAEVSAISVAPDNVAGMIEAIIDRDVAKDAWNGVDLERNVDPNVYAAIGQFETGSATVGTGWVASVFAGAPTSPTPSRINTPLPWDGYYQKLNAGMAAGDIYQLQSTTQIPVNVGDVVEWSAMIHAGLPANVVARLYIKWYDSAQIFVEDDWNDHTPVAAWVRYDTRFTAPVNARYATVGVQLVGLTGATGASAALSVDDFSGSVVTSGWEAVRGASDLTPATNQVTVYDYEAPPDAAVRYRARAVIDAGPVVGQWVYTPGSATWTVVGDGVWLKVPGEPTRNIQVLLYQDRPVLFQPRPRSVFRALGATTAVTISGPLQSAEADLRLITETAAEADALADVATADVVLVHAPAVFDLPPFYAALGDVEPEFLSEVGDIVHRVWRIPFVVVAAP